MNRIMVWGWLDTVSTRYDEEVFIRYDHKKGAEFLSLEPNYSARYPQIFKGWQPKKAMKIRELFHFLFNF